MDDYKNEKEWVALNNIWRSIPQELREENRDNFKLVSELIKNHYAEGPCDVEKDKSRIFKDEYRYLDELSPEARRIVIDLVNDGDKNLYHSIMAIIENNRGRFSSVDMLWDYYSGRFGKTRSYIYRFEKEVREIMELCMIRMDRKGINRL